MGTFTPEEIQAIPGAISSAELFSQAVKTGKRVKYYMISRQNRREILIRYVTPNGNITNGHGKKYTGFANGKPRFTNYWHAYAYKLQTEGSTKW